VVSRQLHFPDDFFAHGSSNIEQKTQSNCKIGTGDALIFPHEESSGASINQFYLWFDNYIDGTNSGAS